MGMGRSNLKGLQVIVFVGIATFMALGFTFVQRSFKAFKAMGPQAKQTRSIQEFDRIEAGGIYEVDVTLGSAPSVILEAPKDLLPHLTSTISGGTLSLGSDTPINLSGTSKIKAHVVTRRLIGATISGAGIMVINGKIQEDKFEAHASGAATLKLSAVVNSFDLEASGAAKASINGLGAKTLKVETSGAATCTIDGSADSSSIEASGASNIKGQLTSNMADVSTSGDAHATLRVVNSLTGEATGASSITYSGNPKATTHTSGVANINRGN
jgi:hypothetical protein